MSHQVNPSDLASTASPYGVAPYLVYTGASGSARINHVAAEVVDEDGRTRVQCTGFGRGIPARVEAGTTLTLLWPAHEHGGFSLIADGTGSIEDDVLSIEITDAVLHRPAPVDGAESC